MAALPKAAKTVEAEYALPYLAHAPMEPLNCTVKLSPDKCELWIGTQFQTLEQKTAAEITGLKPEQVFVHTTFLGGGFGRRANPSPDIVFEAVHIAKAANAPVKTVWSREDDMRGGFYRPAFVHKAKVGLDADGKPVAWQHVMAGQSIIAGTFFEPMMVKNGIDAHFDRRRRRFALPHRCSRPPRRPAFAETGIPVLWWRSVGHSHTAFAMESLVDELAHAAGKDPVEYRRGTAGQACAPPGRAESGGGKGRLGRSAGERPRARRGGARILRQLHRAGGGSLGRRTARSACTAWSARSTAASR